MFYLKTRPEYLSSNPSLQHQITQVDIGPKKLLISTQISMNFSKKLKKILENVQCTFHFKDSNFENLSPKNIEVFFLNQVGLYF